MKLFKVRVEYETVIRAKDAKSAEEEADYVVRKKCDSPPVDISAEEIKTVADLPDQWDGRCRPWGERDELDRTIGDLLK